MMSVLANKKISNGNRRKFTIYMKKYWTLYLMLLLPITFFIVFKYIPMTYIQIAFKEYNITKSVWEMDWSDPLFVILYSLNAIWI